jgi:histidyl-tRNA synthetase
MANVSLFDTAHSVARYYGFEPIDAPLVGAVDLKLSKQLKKTADASLHEQRFPTEEKIACMRHFLERGAEKLPSVQLSHPGKALWEDKRHTAQKHDLLYSMHMLGTKQGIAEAVVITTALAILEHLGFKDPMVKINSIGSKDTLARYARDMTIYSKRIAPNLDARGRELLKQGPFSLIATPEYEHLKYEMPHTVSYLNEESRRHFQEVLEYLERNQVAYELDPTLLGSNIYSTETVFEIVDEAGASLVTGSRHNSLAKKIGARKDIPAVGAVIHVDQAKKAANALPTRSPQLFFVQLGFEAKLKSLRVIDSLRRAHIPVYQSLCRDRISAQLEQAQRMQMPYVIIMGQHEAIRNTVLVRNMETRCQDTVRIDDLVHTLKRQLKAKTA